MTAFVRSDDPTKRSRGTMRCRIISVAPRTVSSSAPGIVSRAIRSAQDAWSGS